MQTSAALRLARSLMDEHGLRDWTVGLDRAKARAGATHFGRRRITLSGPLTRLHDEEHVRDTILHEIAHALVGPEHGHDAVWKSMARKVGASDARCFSSEAARQLAPFVGVCAAGHEVRRHKRPTRVFSCPQCSPRFDPAHIFEWTYRGHGFTHHPSYSRELAAQQAPAGAPAPPPVQLALGQPRGSPRRADTRARRGIEGGPDPLSGAGPRGVLSVPSALVEPA